MDLTAQLRTAITSQNLPLPSPSLLHSLNISRTPPLPLASLVATAKARLLASDISSSPLVDPALTSLPLGIDDPQVKEAKLPRDVHVQVLDVEDLSVSRWTQITEMEDVERGEMTRGRRVVRITDEENGQGDEDDGRTAMSGRGDAALSSGPNTSTVSSRSATHKLTVQDCKGKKIFALEVTRMDRIGVATTCIGEKILLKAGTTVARGVILLQPQTCVFLGGKIEAWHKAWAEGRLARLKEAVGA
jgi:RecQ-mediated genome instability protein 1